MTQQNISTNSNSDGITDMLDTLNAAYMKANALHIGPDTMQLFSLLAFALKRDLQARAQ